MAQLELASVQEFAQLAAFDETAQSVEAALDGRAG